MSRLPVVIGALLQVQDWGEGQILEFSHFGWTRERGGGLRSIAHYAQTLPKLAHLFPAGPRQRGTLPIICVAREPKNGTYRFGLPRSWEDQAGPTVGSPTSSVTRGTRRPGCRFPSRGHRRLRLPFRIGPPGTKASRLLYDRLLAEWLVEGRTLSHSEAPTTVVDLSAKYLHFARGYYRKNGRCTGVTPLIKLTLRCLKKW